MKYQFCTYNLWRSDGEGGLVVNDVYYEVVIDFASVDDRHLFKFAKKTGLVDKQAKLIDFSADGDEETIYVKYKGNPLFELRAIRSQGI